MRLTLACLTTYALLTGCGNGSNVAIGLGSGSESGELARSTPTPTGATTQTGVAITVIPDIRDVTFIVPATDWFVSGTTRIPTAAANSLANAASGPIVQTTAGKTAILGQTITDGMTPFQFNFTYPPNNFQLSNVHLVVDTKRDSSATEGIMVDGIFSGRPPASMVNYYSSYIAPGGHIFYDGGGSGGCATVSANCATDQNTYFIDQSLSSYATGVFNTFDFDLTKLLAPTSTTYHDVVKDGDVKVFMMDDSTVNKAYLVINGRTLSSDALSCTNSSTFTFTENFMHNDGYSTASKHAFSGTPCSIFQSSNSSTNQTCTSFEMYYETTLPLVKTDNITITKATIPLRLRKYGGSASAIVVNGVGIAQSGFDKGIATSEVTEWINDATTVAKWDAVIAGTTSATNLTSYTAGQETLVNLDLLDLFGATKVRNLAVEGKLNVSIAGALWAGSAAGTIATRMSTTANRATTISNRTYTASSIDVVGATMQMDGSYFTEVCEIPNDPNSPLSETGVSPVLVDSGIPPAIASVQVPTTSITSTSAKIVWMTDVTANSIVKYGIADTSENQAGVNDKLSLYHEVDLSGLQPYTFYKFQVQSVNRFGNSTTSNIVTFQTKR